MREKDLTAYCGLYCGDCIRYQSEASDLANQLLRELDSQRFSDYAKVKRNYIKEFGDYGLLISLLQAIAGLKCETPCRLGGDGCGGACEIIACIQEKSYEGCWECSDFEFCNTLDFLKPIHGNAPVENLRKIKEHGIDSWTKHREKCYPWL